MLMSNDELYHQASLKRFMASVDRDVDMQATQQNCLLAYAVMDTEKRVMKPSHKNAQVPALPRRGPGTLDIPPTPVDSRRFPAVLDLDRRHLANLHLPETPLPHGPDSPNANTRE